MVKRVLGELDESTDVSSCAQLLVFVRYVFLCDIKEEYLFCTQLETTTTAVDVMEKLSSFFTANRISWENCCGVCMDGAPAMLGSKSGFQKRVKENLCRDMDSEHEALLFYSKVRWLSKGNVVNRVFELRGELKLFLEVQGKDDLLSHFNELQNWQRKVNAGNAAMFENLSTVLDKNEDHLLDPSLKTEITQHLKSLESELKKYFPEFEEEDGKLVRNPFSGTLDIAALPNDVQDEFLDLKNDSAAKDLYEERSLTVFWCSMYQSYPKVSEIALRVLLPFSTTYL
ncbi:zinc finger BED domain-containing protein 5-like [Homarus americanus]|uniref:zinc finger BED domain-containing protein 5-like n=1 Tax=Homarus americanus TaxID=6706 RepID=UPI001C449DC3|nr:zinc finger BED domain-containing protein 5-like [Homarus americanus]